MADPEITTDDPATASPRLPDGKTDSWEKIDILLKPVGGFLTASMIAYIGYLGSEILQERQQAYRKRLNRVAKEVIGKQIATLPGSRASQRRSRSAK